MRNLRVAISFLTRIPVPIPAEPRLAAAVPWFPIAGALIGAMVGGAAAGLFEVVPPFVAAAVAIMFGVLLTGAFHEDGLADVADAFAGGWTPSERVRILDDPLHGSYGVAALCGSIVVRVVSVGSLDGPAVAFASLLAAHVLGRAAAVTMMMVVPPARPDGLGADHAADLRRGHAAVGVAAGALIAAAATGWWIGPLVAAGAVAIAVVGWLACRKIGGITGDVLGTVEQVTECAVLVVTCGLAWHGELWWPR